MIRVGWRQALPLDPSLSLFDRRMVPRVAASSLEANLRFMFVDIDVRLYLV